MRGSGDTPNLSGDYSGEDTILSGEAASKSPGTGEQFLSGGDERGVVFTHRGRHRGRLSGSLTQGVSFKQTNYKLTNTGKNKMTNLPRFP